MDSEDWKDIKTQNREFRQNQAENSLDVIKKIFPDDNIEIIQNWHIRIQFEGKILDIYPQRKKFHDITNNKRGQYSILKEFINKYFDLC